MLIQPGRSPRAGAGSLLELLHACHARIRGTTDLLGKLADRAGSADLQPPAAEVADAAEAVRRYLVLALPLHAADEDLSITPRLRGRRPDLAAALDRMHREHAEQAPVLAEAIELCEALVRSPDELGALAARLRRAARALAEALLAHVEEEERVLFPAIAALPADDQAAIVGELRARRAEPA